MRCCEHLPRDPRCSLAASSPPKLLSQASNSGEHCDFVPSQELALRNAAGRRPGPLQKLQGTPHAGFVGRTPCGFLHEGRGCNEHTLHFLPQAYLRALPV